MIAVRPRSAIAVAAFAVACLCGLANAQDLPANWVARPHEGGMLYEPRDLPAGSSFNLWSPPVSEVGSAGHLQAFEQVKREGLRGLDVSGMRAQCQDAAVGSRGHVTQSCRVEGSGRPAVNLQFVMLPPRDGKVHWYRILVAGNPSLLERYKDNFKAVLDVAMRDGTSQWAGQGSSAPARAMAPGKPAAKPKNDEGAIARAVMAQPGQGVKPSEMETVLFSWRQTMYVTGLQYEETIYLLMKDGTAYKGLSLAPEDFDAAASRRLEPGRWVQWRKSGKTYQVKGDDDKEWRDLQAWPATPGRRDERLAKTFTHHWYASYGGLGGSASMSSYVFKADGRFEQVGRSITGTGVLQSNNGFNATTGSSYSGKGTSTSTTMSGGAMNATESPAVAGGTTRTGSDGAAHTGSYRIDGWRIELRRDNGEVERKLFLYTSDKREGVNMGGTNYSGPSKD